MIVVKFADWHFCCVLPLSGSEAGGGLTILFASYKGQAVLNRASQPFAIVPYHHASGPFFKDGLGPKGGGVPYMPLKPHAPNAGDWALPASAKATTEAQAIVVEKIPAGEVEPARAVVWAKLQVGNYQYIHQWAFLADGSIEPAVGLGGPLFGSQPWINSAVHRARSHMHSFYFRLDFAVGTGGNQVVERQEHSGITDVWVPFTKETKHRFDPAKYTRWRIRHRTKKNAGGQFNSYEIVPGSADPPDGTFSTGDFWVIQRAGFGSDLGAEVGTTDKHIESGYGHGAPLGTTDRVIWYALREHHRTASLGEEKKTLPYHFDHFTIRPRNFLGDTPTKLYKTVPLSP